MTTISLTKHHGLGNDFLVLLDPPAAVLDGDMAALARRLCDRRRGVGADGLLLGITGDAAAAGCAARMVLYNADGSRAEMSGNGIRCLAQAIARRAGGMSHMRILTDAGERLVTIESTRESTPESTPESTTGGDLIEAAVDMGEVGDLPEPRDWDLLHCDPLRPVRHLDLGNPHSVVAVDDVAAVDLSVLGAALGHVNLEIVEPGPEPHAIRMRVHERGAGITEACGTGACAAAWAAAEWGVVIAPDGEIVVHMDGGDARVRLHQPSPGRVTLVGPAQFVAAVEVELPRASAAAGNA